MKKCALFLLLIFVAFCGKKTPLGPRTPATATEAQALQADTASRLGLPVEKTIQLRNGVTMDFILIPAGEFHMGSKKEHKRDWDEGPVHHVKITKPFYLGKYEVTQLQYETMVGKNPKSEFHGDQLPIENVEWPQAVMFCNAAGGITGTKLRLPTEAEWEYACRAGTDTEFYTGNKIEPGDANFDSVEAYNKSKKQRPLDRTAKVGSYPPNPFGLYDMHGNVWEWCADKYDSKYYKVSPAEDPHRKQDEGSRVVRGGSWNNLPQKIRSANRSKRRESSDRKSLGFRVVMEIEN